MGRVCTAPMATNGCLLTEWAASLACSIPDVLFRDVVVRGFWVRCAAAFCAAECWAVVHCGSTCCG